MATTDGGILSPFSGKVGTVIGVVRKKGKQIIRKIPSPSSKPRSLKQLAQNNKMKLLAPFFVDMKEFLAVSFKQEGDKRELDGYNTAKSENLKTGIKGVYPNQEIDWTGIVISKGTRAIPEKVTVTAIENGFELEWGEDFDIINGSIYDRTVLVIYFPEHKYSYSDICGSRRSALKETFNIPVKKFKGKEAHIYLAFKDIHTFEISNSLYCGSHYF